MPKSCGGLGIRDPKATMQALHAKPAWSFLEQKTLWARFAKSRFRIGEKGSGIWNSFNHLVSSLQECSTWTIGRGDTLAEFFCWRLGSEPPSHLKSIPMKSILTNGSLRLELSASLHARGVLQLCNTTIGLTPDRCSWQDAAGFSVKAFRAFGQTLHPHRRWAASVWRPWFPPKMSCFIWKLFHRALPTDDAIRRLGIPITSKCSCCTHPIQESTIHLFF
ncbi:hypothetical protein QQ045_002566 [Rhodiola kirilowii]